MKKSSLNIFNRAISLFLVIVFSVSFLHSELSQCSLNEEHHDSHDYCVLVKGAITQLNSTIVAKVFEFNIVKELYVSGFNNITPAEINISFGNLKENVSPPSTYKLYIADKAFLI